MADLNFARIKNILDDAMERWTKANSREPRMKGAHDGPIGWSTKEELINSQVYGLKFIETEKIGNGKAEETNLVKILRRNIGGFRRMPSRGPYLDQSEIAEIIEWINSGAPD